MEDYDLDTEKNQKINGKWNENVRKRISKIKQ